MAAITLGLLRGGAGSRWDPEQVRLQVCDPAAIPERHLGIRVIGGDRVHESDELCASIQVLDRGISKGVSKKPTERLNAADPAAPKLRRSAVLHDDFSAQAKVAEAIG